MQAYYPQALLPNQGGGGPPPMAQAPMDFAAFGNSLSNGLSTGIAAAMAAAQQLAAPLQPTRSSTDWTDLQKEHIMKLMGLPAMGNFSQVPPIWQEFLTEGKTTAAVERVLKSKVRTDPDDPDTPNVIPYISRRTAKDIVNGSFAPQEMTVESTIQGIMPLAFAPRSGAEQAEAQHDDDDEDFATYISIEAVRARRIKVAVKARAPKNYVNMVDALRAANMVWSTLFNPACPFVIASNALRAALASHKEQLKESMTPSNVAGIMWGVSMIAHAYIQTPYNVYGQAPSPKFEYLIATARGCTFLVPINMPLGFAGGPEAPPPRPVAAYANPYQAPAFGENAGQRHQPITPVTNPNVTPVIKTLCDNLRQLDPFITMASLLRNSSVNLVDVVLVDGSCVNFHSFGVCRRGDQCHFNHDPTARPSPERVTNFLNLVKPIADNFPGNRRAKRARRGPGG
jgi:hypothetical protein